MNLVDIADFLCVWVQYQALLYCCSQCGWSGLWQYLDLLIDNKGTFCPQMHRESFIAASFNFYHTARLLLCIMILWHERTWLAESINLCSKILFIESDNTCLAFDIPQHESFMRILCIGLMANLCPTPQHNDDATGKQNALWTLGSTKNFSHIMLRKITEEQCLQWRRHYVFGAWVNPS